MSSITPTKTFWPPLPNDITLYILSFLGIKNLVKIAQVCKNWNEASKHDYLWKRAALTAKVSANENFKDAVCSRVNNLRLNLSILTMLDIGPKVDYFTAFSIADITTFKPLLEQEEKLEANSILFELGLQKETLSPPTKKRKLNPSTFLLSDG